MYLLCPQLSATWAACWAVWVAFRKPKRRFTKPSGTGPTWPMSTTTCKSACLTLNRTISDINRRIMRAYDASKLRFTDSDFGLYLTSLEIMRFIYGPSSVAPTNHSLWMGSIVWNASFQRAHPSVLRIWCAGVLYAEICWNLNGYIDVLNE